jgi:hypothetical protein
MVGIPDQNYRKNTSVQTVASPCDLGFEPRSGHGRASAFPYDDDLSVCFSSELPCQQGFEALAGIDTDVRRRPHN